MIRTTSALPALLLALGLASRIAAASETIQLSVDAREAPRKMLHARLTLPAAPGPLLLRYPEWIPGEHGPTGPISSLSGLHFHAAGEEIPWHRDPGDLFTFHLDVPPGASAVEASLDFILPGEGQFSAGASSTDALLVLSWNHVLLLPDRPAADVQVAASLTLPDGWKLGTALPSPRTEGATTRFGTVSAETLVDSPLVAGRHYRHVALAPGTKPEHHLHVVADSAAALELAPEHEKALSRLVTEALALFGTPHYESYHFLLTLSDHVASFGLEHHASSDNRIGERALVDEDERLVESGLLPHELVHSWCGKHRRPGGLVRPTFHEPVDTSLLWVYEGLTSYLGLVLTGRSGLATPDELRASLAYETAILEAERGRTWRSLLDTAVAARDLFEAPFAGKGWRRSVDFYEEGVLIWLEADVTIRKLTKGKRSLDDFCRAFLGGKATDPRVMPYTMADLVGALGEIAPHDWEGFFAARLGTSEHAPVGGIEGAGWRLAYAATRSEYQDKLEDVDERLDLRSSLGILLDTAEDDVLVKDVIPGSPAARAGLAPDETLRGVDGRLYSSKALRQALRDAATSKRVRLLVENGAFYRELEVAYDGGERYPVLERDGSTPDLLTAILTGRSR